MISCVLPADYDKYSDERTDGKFCPLDEPSLICLRLVESEHRKDKHPDRHNVQGCLEVFGREDLIDEWSRVKLDAEDIGANKGDDQNDDVSQDDEEIEVTATVESFKTLSDRFRAAGLMPAEAGLRMIPNQEMELGVDDTLQVIRAIESIEELDDVQNVYSNLKISEEAMAAMESE